MTAGLTINRLDFGYGRRRIGRNVSFAIGPGEVVCLLGANGDGKTTLFKTVLGLIPAMAGQVSIGGEDVQRWSARRRARAIAYVPQNTAGQFGFTIKEMVLMGRTSCRSLFSPPSAEDVQAADAALADLEIAHLAERNWLRVSGGERQLALIARALAQETRIMVLDEPTASLDFGNQVRVVRRLRAIADKGIALLFSTHHPEQAFASATRVAVLHAGELMRYGTPTEVLTPETIKTVYGVAVEVVAAGQAMVCVPRT